MLDKYILFSKQFWHRHLWHQELLKRFLVISLSTLFLTNFFEWSQPVYANQTNNLSKQPNSALPKEVETGLNYLLELVNKKGAAFDQVRIGPLLDFVAQGGYEAEKLDLAKYENCTGSCLRREISVSLELILRYAYNPSIPSFVVFPSVMRLCDWYPESDIVTSKAKLWNKLPTIDKPILLWGKQYEVTTPDSFAGAYYRYDSKRLIILLKHKDRKVLVSVSKMSHKSKMGKKAVIIDNDNWNYFYSGIKGLNLKHISWMDTYMYDSFSVQIYYEADHAAPRTVSMLFKWLSAGWLGINVVKRSHILEGSIRAVESLKKVIESNSLPDSDDFARRVKQIKAMSENEIDNKIKRYSINFERIAKNHKDMSKKKFARIIANGGYANVLNREERLSILMLEYLKGQLGKQALVEFDFPTLPK